MTAIEKMVEWLEHEISLEFGAMDLSHGRKMGLKNSLTKALYLAAEEKAHEPVEREDPCIQTDKGLAEELEALLSKYKLSVNENVQNLCMSSSIPTLRLSLKYMNGGTITANLSVTTPSLQKD